MRTTRHSGDESDPVGQPSRSSAIIFVEAVSVLAFAALLAPLVLRVAGSLSAPVAWPAALVGAGLGYLAADVVSGLVHWFCDRFFEEDTPLVGPLLIFPFRDHHRDPRAMTRHGVLELSGNSCLSVLPLLVLAWAWPGPIVVDAAFAVFTLAVLATNFVHSWAHAERVPGTVARLQAWGVILKPAEHAVHHAPGNRGSYCVTSGWANRWLDGLAVFARLERALVRLGLPATRHP